MAEITRRSFTGPTAAAAAGISISPVFGRMYSSLQPDDLFSHFPTIPYGAVYFRKSNPPSSDWDRDYKRAAQLGINSFRHWFMWSAIEIAPGKYDWDDYDRQMDLSAKYGIKSVIADILATAPEWAFKEFPHARVEDIKGNKTRSGYTVACAVGGWPGLCLDNEEVKDRAEAFLKAMVARYKDHPGLGGYDTWNEQNHFGDAGGCWCEASSEKWRTWVKDKYGNLDSLAQAWNRYSYRSWDDIKIPRHDDFYGDAIDWILFRIDNAHRLMKWRVDTIKSIDPDHPVTAHGIPRRTLQRIGPSTYHVWKAGALVDGFGFSGGSNHEEWAKNRWVHWITSDLTRAGAQGKPFWCAEMPSGYSWWAKGVEMDNGRVATPDDIKLFSMTSFAGGATGIFSPRWRPLVNGRLTGQFGFCALDGSITDRARMAGEVAKWANHPERKELWKAKPVRGDIGIVVIPESQIQNYLREKNSRYYYRACSGAYQAFLFNNVQADFVYSENINNDYDVLYLPYPLMIPEKIAESLKSYVKNGGTLISEMCPGFFGDHGEAGMSQPNYGLDKIFGAEQSKYQFTPEVLEGMKFSINGNSVTGGVYLQAYKPTTGKISGVHADGSPAIIDNHYGNGNCRLIGTSPGYGYLQSDYLETDRVFFKDLLRWAGKEQHVECGDSRIVARIHEGDGYFVLWIINSAREKIATDLRFSGRWSNWKDYKEILNNGSVNISGSNIGLDIPAREAVILKFNRKEM